MTLMRKLPDSQASTPISSHCFAPLESSECKDNEQELSISYYLIEIAKLQQNYIDGNA